MWERLVPIGIPFSITTIWFRCRDPLVVSAFTKARIRVGADVKPRRVFAFGTKRELRDTANQ
jgi:hypothetical protein